MSFVEQRRKLVKTIHSTEKNDFSQLALEIFRFQAEYNSLYAEYLNLLNIDPTAITNVENIPFLPIRFFKNKKITTGEWQEEMIFTSSGTTGQSTAKHYVRQADFYLKNCKFNWKENYGKVNEYCVLALLPAYLEREGSSLIYMAENFIQSSTKNESGFFLYDTNKLLEKIKICQEKNTPTVLLGVSFALLDLAENYRPNLAGIMVMETGGMKGRRKEITRTELHNFLCNSFNVKEIHSEYGMTELFSQAYSKGQGIFQPTPTLRVFTREITDPLCPQKVGKTGAVNIIDLANIDTISFIATDDLGRCYADGSFEILGRLDASDIRGCNLLIGT